MSNIQEMSGNFRHFWISNDNALEDKIQGVLRGIDAEVDTENTESCHRLKGKGTKGRVILKLSKRKDAEKIKLNKKRLKNIENKKIGFSSGMKVFMNEACVAITRYFGQNVKIYFWKKRLLLSGLQIEQ